MALSEIKVEVKTGGSLLRGGFRRWRLLRCSRASCVEKVPLLAEFLDDLVDVLVSHLERIAVHEFGDVAHRSVSKSI